MKMHLYFKMIMPCIDRVIAEMQHRWLQKDKRYVQEKLRFSTSHTLTSLLQLLPIV